MSGTPEQPPEGVRLRFADGSAVECALSRAPALDRRTRKGTVAYWAARPARPVDPALTYEVECDRLPAMTGFSVVAGGGGRTLADWAPPLLPGPAGGDGGGRTLADWAPPLPPGPAGGD